MSRARRLILGTRHRITRTLKLAVENRTFLSGCVMFFFILFFGLLTYPLSIPYPRMGEYRPNPYPNSEHLLGVDMLGRDWFHMLLYSIQSSLYIGFLAGGLATLIGIAIGFTSGYAGGATDDALRTFMDTLMVIPLWPILVLISFSLRTYDFFILSVILAIFSWPMGARTIRSQVLSVKERSFIDLAKLSGFSNLETLFLEIFPNMIPYLTISYVTSIGGSMLAEVGLELVGLGPIGAQSLGLMLYWCQRAFSAAKGQWWMVMAPMIALVGIFVSLYLISLGVDEIVNPRLRGQ